jgi:hypothetical protein
MRLRRFNTAILLITLAAGASACDSGPTTPAFAQVANGYWTGSVDGIVFELVINELDDEILTGSGNVQGPALAIAVIVLGSNVYPAISVTLRSHGFEDINLIGRWIGRDLIRGRVNGAGFDNDLFWLRRRAQPPVVIPPIPVPALWDSMVSAPSVDDATVP